MYHSQNIVAVAVQDTIDYPLLLVIRYSERAFRAYVEQTRMPEGELKICGVGRG